MNKWILVPTAICALAVALGVATTGSAQEGDGRTLTLFEDVSRESSSLIDNAPRSPARNPDSRRFRLSRGDELVARTPVLDRKGGARLGTAFVHAAVVEGRRFENAALQADVLLVLRDGTIALAGLAGPEQRPFAVLGGTGAYEGARGSATERELAGGAQLTVRLQP